MIERVYGSRVDGLSSFARLEIEPTTFVKRFHRTVPGGAVFFWIERPWKVNPMPAFRKRAFHSAGNIEKITG